MLRILRGGRLVQSSRPEATGGDEVQVEEVGERAAAREARGRWLSLLERCACEIPYLRPEWYQCALETVDGDSAPRLLFFSSGGEDVALAPLVLVPERHWGLGFQRLTFVRNGYTPFQDLLSTRGFGFALENAVAYARLAQGPLGFLDLNELRAGEGFSEAVGHLASRQELTVHRTDSSESRFLKIDGTFESKVAGLDKKAQHEFRRKVRKFGTLGESRLVRFEDPREVQAELGRFFEMYERTWKGAEPHPGFYRRVCEEFGRLKRLYFYGLLAGPRVAAYVICLRGGSVMFGLKTTYEPELHPYSPGVVLFHRVIEELYRTPGVEEFDIGRGNEQYKREWTSLSHGQVRLVVEPRNAVWKVVAGAKRIREMARKRAPVASG